MTKKNKTLNYSATALIAMFLAGCDVHRASEIFTPIPKNPDRESLFWDPREIQVAKCPDISGTYIIREEQLFTTRPAVPLGLFPKKNDKNSSDVLLIINQTSQGISFTGKTKETSGTHYEELDGEELGCSHGLVVRRWSPHLINGAESGKCLGVSYGETHWRLDSQGNLEAREIIRNRCWNTRGRENISKDTMLPVKIYERVP
ncbi:hypothetical protein [Guyparkeria halopsychrophila]|uniref:hypothetical protein n=1 Tax=Guyparkeria halopsychrophila TaxID=3139421 RepID=UPI0037C5A08F